MSSRMRTSKSSEYFRPSHGRERSSSGSELDMISKALLQGLQEDDQHRHGGTDDSNLRTLLISKPRSHSLHLPKKALGLKHHSVGAGAAGLSSEGNGFFARFATGLRLRSPSFRAGSSLQEQLRMSPHLTPRRGSSPGAGIPTTYGTTGDVGSFGSPTLPPPYYSPGYGPDLEKGEGLAMQKMIECLVFGVVNSILTIPCMYAYAAVIFRAPFFQPHIADLSKLVLFSSVIHQLAFSLKSSLPFSIGQVQDAGLIFLSTMATAIANSANPDAILPTTLVTLSVSTAMLGLSVYVIGRLRLAKLVSYLPMPVVGGYLAFIGFFCLEAGIGLSIGEDVSSVADLTKTLNSNAMKLASPSIIGGAMLAIVSKKIDRWYALPVSIIALPCVFYLILWMTDTSIEQAQIDGWLAKPQPGENTSTQFWEVWYLFDFNQVEWHQIPRQVLTWVSMVFVVSFSSCLDVVAIEMDMGKELDINHELCTVGLSNVASGLTGGFTGSYIFSQTIFTFRTGTNSRLVGLVVIITEFFLFVAPFNVMEYVPLYFFAATLIFIAFDLMYEWLFLVWSRVSRMEYLVLLATFLFITITDDLMLGIMTGIGLAILSFIIAYSSVTHVEQVNKTTSNVMRDFERRRMLGRLQKQVVRFDLHGYLFFGSSVQIVRKMQARLDAAEEVMIQQSGGSSVNLASMRNKPPKDVKSVWWTTKVWNRITGRRGANVGTNDYHDDDDHHRDGDDQTQDVSVAVPPHPLVRQNSTDTTDEDVQVRFLVLDFHRVTGIDATAISTGLMRVKQIAMQHDITIVFTCLREEFEQLLIANHVMSEGDESCKVFAETNDGLEWVENELLREHGLQGNGSPFVASPSNGFGTDEDDDDSFGKGVEMDVPTMPNIPFAYNPNGTRNKVVMSLQSFPEATIWLRRILVEFFGVSQSELEGIPLTPSSATQQHEPDLGEYDRLTDFFGLMRFRKDDFIFHIGDPADMFFIVMVGEVSLFVPKILELNKHDKAKTSQYGKLLQRARYGCIFGEIHFTLEETRQFNAIATEDTAVFFLSRSRFQELQNRYPKLAIGLYQCLTKFLSITVQDLQNYKGMM